MKVAVSRFFCGLLAAALVPAFGCDGCGASRSNYPARDAGSTNINLPDGGRLEVAATFNQCPAATLEVSPAMPRVGQVVTLNGEAQDPDSAFVTYTWKATAGALASAFTKSTTFDCVDAGPVTLTLTVSDGSCETARSTTIFCVAMRDGGASGSDASSGAYASDGGAQVVDICPLEPTSGTAVMCTSCTTENCALAPPPDGDSGCCGLPDPNDRILCQAVAKCFGANAPACTAGGDPTRCFCGTSGGACFSTIAAANGPCTAQVIAAAKTSDPAMIRTQFTGVNSPLGRATNLTACRGSFCTTECTVP